jgi:hypothetical protein
MEITINYDTVSYSSQIICSDKAIEKNLEQNIEDNKDNRITAWFEEFIVSIKSNCNNDPFSIKITGCDTYERDFIESVLKKEKDFIENYKITFIKENQVKARHKSIDAFINYALNSNDELIQNAINPRIGDINFLRNNEVEIPVVATMSSGKSTLLNALIGQDILDENTGATTATICKISLENKLKSFYAYALNNGEKIKGTNSNFKQFLKEWNAKGNLKEFFKLKLYVEGPPIEGFNTSNLKVSFIDTPGPNSAKNTSHKDQTFKYLKDANNLPIVLYVLDPEKMDSRDDDDTIREISKVISDNKQDLNRIVFIYNKIDTEFNNNNSFDDVLIKIKKFLKNHDIEKPKIFPVCTHYAKLARNKNNLSYSERGDFENFSRKLIPSPEHDHKGYLLLDHFPLNENQKNKLSRGLEKDKELFYSGLAAIQLYIEDYIANHHSKNRYQSLFHISREIRNQVKTSLDSRKEDLIDKTAKEEKKNEEKARIEKCDLIKRKKDALDEIENVMTDTSFVRLVIRDINKSFNRLKDKIYKSDNYSDSQIEAFKKEGFKIVENLKVSVKTDLISKMNIESKEYLKKLRKVVSKNFEIENLSLKSKTFNAELLNKINVLNLTNTDSFKTVKLERESIEVTEKVESKWWLKRLFNWKVDKKDMKTIKTISITFNKNKFTHEFLGRYSKEINRIVDNEEKEFNNTISIYAETFKKLVETSFEQSMNHVYKSSEEKSEQNMTGRTKLLNELERIEIELLQFKL